MKERFRGSGCRVLLIAGSLLVAALPAKAQSIPVAVPRSRWMAEVTPGLFVQPYPGGGTGGPLAITIGRAARSGTWSPSLLLAAARVGDVGYHLDNSFIIDRDWGITALGVDAFCRSHGVSRRFAWREGRCALELR